MDPLKADAPTGENQNTDPQGQAGQSQQQEFNMDTVLQAIKEGNEETFRRAQGLVDTNANRMSKEVREEIEKIEGTIAGLRKGGVEISPEQEQEMKRQALDNHLLQKPESPEAGQQQQTTAQAQATDPFTAEAHRIMESEGITFESNDPELATLVQDGTGFDYVESVRAAVAAKKARVGAAPPTDPGPTRLPTGAGVLGSQSTPNYLEMDDGDLFEEGFRK